MQISDEMLADAVRAIPGVKMTNADDYNVSPADVMRAALSAILPAALAAERERCAIQAENSFVQVCCGRGHVECCGDPDMSPFSPREIAEAIRALGDANDTR